MSHSPDLPDRDPLLTNVSVLTNVRGKQRGSGVKRLRMYRQPVVKDGVACDYARSQSAGENAISYKEMSPLPQKFRQGAVVACVLLMIMLGPACGADNLRFHASFDTGLSAHPARGNGRPVLAAKAHLTKGKIGQAVRFDMGTRLAFATAKHVNPGSGTIGMWIRVRSLTLRRSAFGLIDCGNAKATNNDIFVAWFRSLNTLGATFDAVGATALNDHKLTLIPGKWYYVACAWDCRRGVQLYFAGKQILDRKTTWKPTPVSARFVVGSDHSFSLPFFGAVDEISVYDRALGVDEVRQLRHRESKKLPRFNYRQPYSGPLARLRIDAQSYMDRQQRQPLAHRPQIKDIHHIDIDYDRKFYSGHPQQAVFAYYGQGEIVIGYNRAPCNYKTKRDVRHGPGGYHGRSQVVLRRSLDFGRTWPKSTEVVIYRESDPPEKKRAFLFQPTARRDNIDMFSPDSLFFFTRTWLPELKGKLVCAGIRSADRGRTWEDVPTIVPNPLIKGGDVLESCHPVLRMPDGKTLLAVLSMNMPAAPKHSGPVLFQSTDNGLSWQYEGLVRGKPSGTEGGRFAYPGLLRMPDGKLHCYFVHIGGRYEVRGVRNAICMTESRDKGKSWSDPVPITSNAGQGCWKNPGPLNKPPGASNYRAPWPILLRDGRVLVLFNRRRMPVGIGGVLSSDGGKTWSHEFAIRDDGVGTDSGYPVGCQFEDGRIFVAYYFTKPDGNKFGGTRFIAGSFFQIDTTNK